MEKEGLHITVIKELCERGYMNFGEAQLFYLNRLGEAPKILPSQNDTVHRAYALKQTLDYILLRNYEIESNS